ncbi:PHD finger protein MALE MEIOCYTE DEATH 1 [Platanthera zijinensis]|uniref:PHD finger protein MALE MEIOCYTE DEATH 1 n=1 Tax=Platanthera zijinensis TaxID=2320716 RepID=A0AAP0B7B4_9ASPA
MDLWDRFCTSLQVREVTVVDTSRKSSIDLRLLLGVAYGGPWFSRWGYQFQMGSFGVTEDVYRQDLDRISSLPLGTLVADSAIAGRSWEISRIIAVYRRLRWSDPGESFTRLATVRDLLRYLLDLKTRPGVHPPLNPPAPPPMMPRHHTKRASAVDKRKRCRDFDAVAADLESRWPVRRLRVAADVIVEALQEHGGMTRQEVRDAARLTIGDTGLLDFVLKSLGNCVVGRHVVRRTSNPATRVLEFRLEEIQSGGADAADEEIREEAKSTEPAPVGADQIERELEVVCQALVAARPEATRTVLDGKHWVKKWPLVDDKDDRLRFLCEWVPSAKELKKLTRPLPPPEVVLVLEAHASVGDLRMESEMAMRETYCMMEAFRVTSVDGVEGEEWDPVMTGGVQSGSVVVVRGEGVDMGCELRYEGGADSWTVDCACGAQDDDGERMVACDSCDVWHHTRCTGISDDQPVPPLFLCSRCGSSILGAAASEDSTFDLSW